MTAGMAARGRATGRVPGFGATLASEWTKLMSVRSTYILAGLAVILSIGMTALVAIAVGSTWDEWNERDRAEFHPVTFTIVGSIFSIILFSVLGALAFASEYSSGMIRLTLTATPQRGRVLFAKAVVVGIITLVAGTVSAVGMFVTGQAVLGAFDMPTVGLGDSDALRTVVALSVQSPLFPIVGLTLAVLLRSTAGSITAVLALVFAPSIFGGLLPNWWQENVLAYNLSSASDALTLGHIEDLPSYLDAPLAAVVVVVWMVVFLGAAYFMLNRRDA